VRNGKAASEERGVDFVLRAGALAAALLTVLRVLTAAMKISCLPVATQYGANGSFFHDFATQSDYIRTA
jgi:hypothetical protein